MDMELMFFHLVAFIKDIGMKIKHMGLVLFGIKVVKYILVNFMKIELKVMGFTYIKMALIMKGSGSKTNKKVLVEKYGQMAKSTMEASRTE